MARRWARLGLLLMLAWTAGSAKAERQPTEHDYFEQLPVVLTVNRLEQALNDAPGAVTVIDRETIRRSGARDVTDLLRLVPGYLVSGWNGAQPNAAYHVPLDDFGTRNLVMIDGRSVYSPLHLGDTHRGMMGVMLEDIERLEVLRGSNSAAYGANAMFGVISIITRHAADTLGGELSASAGGAHIQDRRARLGWGNEHAAFRLSAGQRADSGLRNAYDDRRLRQLHWRSDLRPSAQDDVLLEAGTSELVAGEGFPSSIGNPIRTVTSRDHYLLGQWRRQLTESEQLKLSADYTEEEIHDVAPYRAVPGLNLDFSGKGRRLNLELQHQRRLAEGLRAVWGLGAKQEDALSRPLYHRDRVTMREQRVFGNLEWQAQPRWLINAGLFVGRHSWTGTYAAPRLMANYLLTPDHTLRFGATRSVRAPTQFELAGDVRYVLNDVLLGRTVAATGQVQPERLASREISYLGQFRDLRLTLDVRLYREELKGLIGTAPYRLPVSLPGTGSLVDDYVNKPGLSTTGVEYQLRWSPREGTVLWFNQNLIDLKRENAALYEREPPRHASTLALFQKLPAGMNLTVMVHALGRMTWRGRKDQLPPTQRLDLRLDYPFRLGSTRAEAALTVQALGGDQSEFLPSSSFRFQRRAFGTLRLEF